MRTIIIDDERPSLELLKRVIGGNDNLEIVGEFTDAQEALEQIDSLVPDVVFADIEMPYLNGIHFAEKISQLDIQIVFVTAYDNYALDAFGVNAVNYILKPITTESLDITVKRLLKNYRPPENIWEKQKQDKVLSLGALQVYGNTIDEPIKWPTLKAKELFAYFICEKGRELDKWQLCDILWPDAVPEKAIHSLHSTMNRMKSALKSAGIKATIKCSKGKYLIDVQNLLWDAEELTTYIRNNEIITKENIMPLENILDLYKGELFESEGYLWAIEQSENIKRYYLVGRNKLAEYYMKQKNYGKAEKHFKKILSTEPASEEAVVSLMEIYCNTGNKVQLIYCYRNLADYLEKELHISPSESTKKQYHHFLEKMQKI